MATMGNADEELCDTILHDVDKTDQVEMNTLTAITEDSGEKNTHMSSFSTDYKDFEC